MSTPTRLQFCPWCETPGVDEVINHLTRGPVFEAAYLCEQGHQFIVKGVQPQPDKENSQWRSAPERDTRSSAGSDSPASPMTKA